ncbi:MAG: YajD family HNH nuclease [Chromatiales bacterium]|nr:YajD family HNH nuclease [Chromatiales bacterium]
MSSGKRRAGDAIDNAKLDAVVARGRQEAEKREAGYREQSLRIHPWICGRCSREFTRANLHELTVHHKDHNHNNNPPDGSNWENLCLYCHDHEHQKYSEFVQGYDSSTPTEEKPATFNPFADLAKMMGKEEK